MFHLLVVDDFRVDRLEIIDYIDYSTIEFASIQEAANGEEALELMKQQLPDIIITDVQMPFMGGIDFAKNVREQFGHIPIIFMSYYNDFNYLKSAIDLNAYGYILKPFKEEEVHKALIKVLEDLDTKLKAQEENMQLKKILDESKPLLINRFYKDVLTGFIKDERFILEKIKYFKQTIDKNYYHKLFVLELDNEKINPTDLMIYPAKIHQKIDQIEMYSKGLIYISVDEFTYVYLISDNKKANVVKISEKFTLTLEEVLRDKTLRKVVSVGVSHIAKGVGQIHQLYKQGISAVEYKFYYGNGQVIEHHDINNYKDAQKLDLSMLQKEISELLYKHDEKSIHQYLDNLFQDTIITSKDQYVKTLCFGVIMCIQTILNERDYSFHDVFGDKETAIWEKLLQFDTIVDLKQWIYNIIYFTSAYLDDMCKSQNQNLVEEIKEYMNNFYYKNITLKEISEVFYFTPNYVNRIFKKEMGKTIPEYLINIRLEKAKKMLEKKEMKIYEIIEKVGYTKASHFNHLFKKYTGMTPREYRYHLHN